ncbi:helix-turn-helix transcriptional regulator [Sphingobacterium yanglingense]|uniref:DNA-binding CsgD family transcriptional regulator n=1 Tax=Sphingobacterium yanglingense TaxID=1437280 RepID=A0A4R6WJ63_9SPHI|nr:hypothetical protein [Sphingobacterium yanglingense]TDQ78004.1 DNA-binding CsgD family transcriptional regulator [Sphingobacterium yanglingense]
MNLLFAKHLLPLVPFLLFFTSNITANGADSVMKEDYSEKREQVPIESLETGRGGIVEQNAFDFLFDVDRNKELLKSEDYRSLLAKSLINKDRIKDFAIVDSYIFKEIGVSEYLLDVLKRASELTAGLSDNNRKFFYSCLIDASIAGLKSSVEEQQKWYSSAYENYRSIDEKVEESRLSESIGITSHALANALSHKTIEADEVFLQGIAQINEEKVEDDDYFLLFKYIHFLAGNSAYDKVEKWLNYTLSLTKTGHDAYYKTLAYYNLVLLKVKQGLPDVSAQYLREYQLSKVQLNSQELVRIAFVESNYYDFGNTAVIKDDKGIMAFGGLAFLIIGAAIGASVYLCRYGKIVESALEKEIEPNESVEWSIASPNALETSYYDATDKESVVELKAAPVEYISDLKKMAENNDPLFMKKFKQLFRDFAECVGKKAETPLNLAELEVCAYTKLGYTTKEVAYYRGDSIRSVENRKYRIRRKLNLPRDVDFTDWVLTA